MTRSRELAELASAYDGSSLGFRNRIINGDMRIDQRNAGAGVGANNNFPIDRWQARASATGKYNAQRNAGSVTPPSGFTNYLGATSLTAWSLTSGDYAAFEHRIEGFNVADFAWGTVNAQTVTLSFRVYSSLTGTFGGAIGNDAFNRSYPFSYTVSAANTWTTISVTIPGDTTGTWEATNSTGIRVWFNLGSGSSYLGTANTWAAAGLIGSTGSVSVVGTNGATFYITGVQLEAGSVATPFERRDYGRELMMCQRYYMHYTGAANNPAIGMGIQLSNTSITGVISMPVNMRASTPTITGGAASTDGFSYNTGITLTAANMTSNALQLTGTISSSGSQGRSMVFVLNGTSAYLGISTEL